MLVTCLILSRQSKNDHWMNQRANEWMNEYKTLSLSIMSVGDAQAVEAESTRWQVPKAKEHAGTEARCVQSSSAQSQETLPPALPLPSSPRVPSVSTCYMRKSQKPFYSTLKKREKEKKPCGNLSRNIWVIMFLSIIFLIREDYEKLGSLH